MIGDGRDPKRPPVDSLAEAIALTYLLHHPERIGDVDLGSLLVFPEHRLCWQAMSRAWMRHGAADWTAFLNGWIAELETLKPGKSLELWETMDCGEMERKRAWEDATERPQHAPGELKLSQYYHGFPWALARLRRIAEARHIIQANQRSAERAWIEDVDGARQALQFVGRQSAPYRIDL